MNEATAIDALLFLSAVNTVALPLLWRIGLYLWRIERRLTRLEVEAGFPSTTHGA